MKRKTIAVERIKEVVNEQLKNDNISQEAKKELCSVLETVLFETDNYNGFNHLKWINGGSAEWMHLLNKGLVSATDSVSRQQYIGPEYNRRYY